MKKMERDLENIPENTIISMSNSSDPYLHLDKTYGDTRKALELLEEYNMRVLIVTKGTHLIRDADLLAEMNAVVTVTITTFTAGKLEPNAPPPEQRIETLRTLSDHGIPTALRLDPIFLHLSKDCERVIEQAVDAGVQHVTSSTFKPKKDSWNRFSTVYPKVAEKTQDLYFEKGKKIGRSYYLPENIRRGMMKTVQQLCQKYGVSFSTCRENLDMDARSCDGSHLFLNSV